MTVKTTQRKERVKVTEQQWEKAKALYRNGGLTLRELSYKVKIDYTQISKKAKKEGWEKGSLQQLATENARNIIEKAHIEKSVASLSQHERSLFETLTHQRLAAEEFFFTASMKNAKMVSDKLTEETTIDQHKQAQDVFNAAMKGAGVVPYYPNQTTAVQINAGTDQNKGQNGFNIVFKDAPKRERI